MHDYEQANGVRPPDNVDAKLRWNACARLLNAHPELAPQDDDRTAPDMLE